MIYVEHVQNAPRNLYVCLHE